MGKIIVEITKEESNYIADIYNTRITQTFTCCGTKLETLLFNGWDRIGGNIIVGNLLSEFKYCPYCGKELEKFDQCF
jgi:hypothetical protein